MSVDKYVSEFGELLASLRKLPILLKINVFERIQLELLYEYDNLATEIGIGKECENTVNDDNNQLSSSTNDKYTNVTKEQEENVGFAWETSIISLLNSTYKMWSSEIPTQTKNIRISVKTRKSDTVKFRGRRKPEKVEDDVFQCAICSNEFDMKSNLIKHVKTHTNRSYPCHLCGKKFSTHSVLRNHISVIHDKVDRFYCNKCQYFSYSMHTLKEHIKIKHEGRYKKYACAVCKVVFQTRCMLKVHLRSHTGEKPYKCDTCDASFICSGHLTNHKNAVHSEKRYTCEVCFKSFRTIHLLKRHTLIHSATKPFNCPLCHSYSANTHGNLTRHIRTVHQMTDFSYLKYKKMLNGEATETDDKWIKNAEPVIQQYLKELSLKVGRNITIDQLKDEYASHQKNKNLTF